MDETTIRKIKANIGVQSLRMDEMEGKFADLIQQYTQTNENERVMFKALNMLLAEYEKHQDMMVLMAERIAELTLRIETIEKELG